MFNHIAKTTYTNRHRKGMPREKCKIEIIVTSHKSGDDIFAATSIRG